MRAREQPGLEGLFAASQRPLQIERSDNAILGRAERQIDNRHLGFAVLDSAGLRPRAALLAKSAVCARIAIIAAAFHHAHGGQKRGQSAHGRRLAGATIAKHEHAADRGIDGGDQQRALHLFLAGNGGKRKR